MIKVIIFDIGGVVVKKGKFNRIMKTFAKVVFGTINPDLIEKAITLKTRAILPVHIAGNVCDMDAIMDIASENGLKVIEDSAQAICASKLRGITASYSFYPAKILGAYGDGGAVATNDEITYETIKVLRNHGGKPKPSCVGYNSRLDNLQAAILDVKLPYLQSFIRRRKEIAEIYDTELAPFALPAFGIKPQLTLPFQREIYQDYIIRSPQRDGLKNHLERKGIETLLDTYPFPDEIQIPPATLQWQQTALRLPCNFEISNQDIKYVTTAIKEFFQK